MEIRVRQLFGRSFWLWLVASIIATLSIFLSGGKLAKPASSLIMAGFVVGPLRDWTYSLTVWGLDTATSLNTPLRNNLRAFLTYRHLYDEGRARVRNDGVYRILRSTVTMLCAILGLCFLVFQGTSANIVQTILRTIELSITGQIKAWRWLLWIFLLSGYAYVLIMNARRVLNGRRWYPIMLIGAMYIKTILTALLLRFSLRLLGAWLMYRTVGIIFIVVTIFIVLWRVRHTPPTPPAPPTAP